MSSGYNINTTILFSFGGCVAGTGLGLLGAGVDPKLIYLLSPALSGVFLVSVFPGLAVVAKGWNGWPDIPAISVAIGAAALSLYTKKSLDPKHMGILVGASALGWLIGTTIGENMFTSS